MYSRSAILRALKATLEVRFIVGVGVGIVAVTVMVGAGVRVGWEVRDGGGVSEGAGSGFFVAPPVLELAQAANRIITMNKAGMESIFRSLRIITSLEV
jgi:hypothetical protein